MDCCINEHNKNQTKRVNRVQSGLHHINECNVFSPWYAWKQNIHLALSNYHPLTDFYYSISSLFCLFQYISAISTVIWIMVGFISTYTIGAHQYYNCFSYCLLSEKFSFTISEIIEGYLSLVGIRYLFLIVLRFLPVTFYISPCNIMENRKTKIPHCRNNFNII